MAWMISELMTKSAEPKTLMPTREASGAMPLTRMLQPAGSGCAELTKFATSYTCRPCAAIELASPNASAPPPPRFGSVPEKSW